jgi:hypothetical protein
LLFPRPVLGLTQRPIEWEPMVLSPEIKRSEREADHSHATSVEVRNAWWFTSTPPIRLTGVMLV